MNSKIEDFEARLSAALKYVEPGVIFLAAVSGGADSTAMLAGLAAVREEKGFALHCIHVEHGIRSIEESQRDAEAVEALCEKLCVPCRGTSIPRGKVAALARKKNLGIQAAARYFRLKALRQEGRRINAEKILIGHTRDDLLENILMRILRGSGPCGLAPMPKSKGVLLRPILDFTRHELLEYLGEKNITYKEDSSNSHIYYLRNRVRLKLIPILNEFFPHWRTSLIALAETQALTAEFITSETKKLLPWDKMQSQLRIKEEDFLKAPQILREEALFSGCNFLIKGQPGWAPRRAVLRSAVEKQITVSDLGPLRIENQDGYIILKTSPQLQCEYGFSLLINEAGFYTLEGKLLGMAPPKKLCIQVTALAQFPLVLRKHRDGDRVRQGRHKRRFSDILGRATNPVCAEVITVCDLNGPQAFIGIKHDGKIIIADGETSARNVFDVCWEHGNV